MTNNVRHALVWLLTVHSAARTSSRTHHRNPGLDIRAIFEEGRENAKLFWHVMARALVFEPCSVGMFCRLPTKYSRVLVGALGERADAPRPFEATWRARKSTTSATGIAVSAALCERLAALPTLRGPPRRYRPRDTRQARAREAPPAAAHAQRR